MRRIRWSTVGAFAAYACASCVYLGVPVARHPGRDLVANGIDADIGTWALGWWPHAILHWQNPIVTHVVWAPEGLNLAWTASVPGLALLVAPVTLIAGPTISYNLLAVALPALAAWTAFLLCRSVTRSFWPSFAGGYLFGFSSYEFGQTEGHLHMTSIFLLPLVVLVLLRFLDGSLSRRRAVVWLGLLLALQLLFSTEVSLMLATGLAVGLLTALVAMPTLRPQLGRLPLLFVGAYLLAAAIDAPFLAYALLHLERNSINSPAQFPADLLNFVVPTRLTWIGWHWTKSLSDSFRGNASENGAYLGLPWIAILGWFFWEKRRQPAARFLLAMVVLGVLAELGTALHIAGDRYASAPWGLVARLPFYNNILPVRFASFVALGAAVAAAWWSASSRAPRLLRIALPVAAIIAIMPSLWLGVWHYHPRRLAFFTHGTYRVCLQPDDNVLMLPAPNWTDAMLWQAEAGYRFRMTGGYISPALPKNVPDFPYAMKLFTNNRGSDWRPLVKFARATQATMIILEEGHGVSWTTMLAPITKPTAIGGVYLYSLRPNGRSACTSGTG
jgi:hypothetical protein